MARLNTCRLLIVCCLLLAACAGSTALPTEGPFLPRSSYSEVYVGEGTAYIWRDDSWVEAPSYHYEFMAIKRLYEGRWSTVKQIYRLHPDYSGLAGPREQTLFFDISYLPAGEGYTLQVEGTLGNGRGRTNRDMSESSVALQPKGNGFFKPFNRIRITQRLDRASGGMSETVELLKVRDSGESPFMKFEERGTVYLPPQTR